MLHKAYSNHATSYGNLDLEVNARINDLYKRAYRLAPRTADSAADSGCTDTRPVSGIRRQKAWDMICEAHNWNALSDRPQALAIAEQCERDGMPYEIISQWDGDDYAVTVKREITLTGDEIWDELGKRGFDPGYQEIMVASAIADGSHYSYLAENTASHVHLTYDTETDTYTLADAGPECAHAEAQNQETACRVRP